MAWLKRLRKNISDTHVKRHDPERRVAPRFSIRQAVTIRFTASGLYEFTGISENLSSSGIFLYTESPIEQGEQVEVTLTLPAGVGDPIPMQVRGRVVRIEKSSAIGIAIAFENLVILPENLTTHAHPTALDD